MRIAIVGTGISGLVAAHLLRHDHELTLFEAADYVGGHTHTVAVEHTRGTVPVDTGFIVFNEWTYPNFCRLLDQLGVASQPSNMSFSVQCARTGLEYAGNNLNSLFAQRRNLVRPSFYRLLADVLRFYRASRELLADDADDDVTLGEYLDRNGYSKVFIDQHVIPMGAAIWSADPQQFQRFPARSFVRFFHNHGMLNLLRRPTWRVIRGGSDAYVQALTAPFRHRIRLCTPVRSIRRKPDRVELATDNAAPERFDEVILAVHSDQALRLLADPTPAERSVLSAISYQRNDVVLHTDERLLPRNRRAWASWNYHVPHAATTAATVTYNMNMLQDLPADATFCVTLNRSEAIEERRVIAQFEYDHPVYTPAAIAAQRRHAEVSGINRTHYCGAWWGYGFHEDGVNSALAVCRHFGRSL